MLRSKQQNKNVFIIYQIMWIFPVTCPWSPSCEIVLKNVKNFIFVEFTSEKFRCVVSNVNFPHSN